MTIKPPSIKQDFSTISASELRSIKPANMGKNIAMFDESQFGGRSIKEFKEALFFHGFYATQEANSPNALSLNLSFKNNQDALQRLRVADPSYTGGTVEQGFGANPDMVELDVEKADEAFSSLADAKQNGHGITNSQAKTIAEWVVQRAKNELFSRLDTSSPYAIRGYCGYGQGIVGHQCEQMGVDVKYHQVANLSDFSTSRHVFNIITIPVKDEDGLTNDKHYLLDTTFRQFFISDISMMSSGNKFKDWGARLTETGAGKKLADEILSKGFAELTEETARLYVEAQVAFIDEGENAYAPAAWETHSALQSLTSVNTVENDYDLSELEHVDIAAPADVIKREQHNPEPTPHGIFSRLKTKIGL